MGGAGVDRSRILGRRGPLSPAARAGPEHFGALDPARESPHGCLVECRAANESRSPALEEEKTALEKTVSGPALPLCYRGLNGCWVFHTLIIGLEVCRADIPWARFRASTPCLREYEQWRHLRDPQFLPCGSSPVRHWACGTSSKPSLCNEPRPS